MGCTSSSLVSPLAQEKDPSPVRTQHIGFQRTRELHSISKVAGLALSLSTPLAGSHVEASSSDNADNPSPQESQLENSSEDRCGICRQKLVDCGCVGADEEVLDAEEESKSHNRNGSPSNKTAQRRRALFGSSENGESPDAADVAFFKKGYEEHVWTDDGHNSVHPCPKVSTILSPIPKHGLLYTEDPLPYLLHLQKANNPPLRFIDDDFLPNAQNCLFSKPSNPPEHLKSKWSSIRFVRALDAVLQPALFLDGINPQDCEQGALGNCWQISAVGAVAAHPELIRNLFNPQTTSPNGIYSVRIFINGKWHFMLVDDYLPWFPSGRCAFGHSSNRNEIWLPLLEKCYAKFFGSYEALTRQSFKSMTPLLSYLTGGSATYRLLSTDTLDKNPEEQDKFFRELARQHHHGSVLCAASQFDLSDGGMGIVTGHGYSILDCRIVEGNQLVKLRNSWGHTEWQGDWSDTSPLWQTARGQRIRIALQQVAKSDGEFWLPFQDFRRNFLAVHICRIFPGIWPPLSEAQSLSGSIIPMQLPQSESPSPPPGSLLLSSSQNMRHHSPLYKHVQTFSGHWKNEDSSAAGRYEYGTWSHNPQFFIRIQNPATCLHIELSLTNSLLAKPKRFIGFSLLKHAPDIPSPKCVPQRVIQFQRENVVTEASMALMHSVQSETPCLYPSTYPKPTIAGAHARRNLQHGAQRAQVSVLRSNSSISLYDAVRMSRAAQQFSASSASTAEDDQDAANELHYAGEYVLVPCCWYPSEEEDFELIIRSTEPVEIIEMPRYHGWHHSSASGQWREGLSGGWRSALNPQFIVSLVDEEEEEEERRRRASQAQEAEEQHADFSFDGDDEMSFGGSESQEFASDSDAESSDYEESAQPKQVILQPRIPKVPLLALPVSNDDQASSQPPQPPVNMKQASARPPQNSSRSSTHAAVVQPSQRNAQIEKQNLHHKIRSSSSFLSHPASQKRITHKIHISLYVDRESARELCDTFGFQVASTRLILDAVHPQSFNGTSISSVLRGHLDNMSLVPDHQRMNVSYPSTIVADDPRKKIYHISSDIELDDRKRSALIIPFTGREGSRGWFHLDIYCSSSKIRLQADKAWNSKHFQKKHVDGVWELEGRVTSALFDAPPFASPAPSVSLSTSSLAIAGSVLTVHGEYSSKSQQRSPLYKLTVRHKCNALLVLRTTPPSNQMLSLELYRGNVLASLRLLRSGSHQQLPALLSPELVKSSSLLKLSTPSKGPNAPSIPNRADQSLLTLPNDIASPSLSKGSNLPPRLSQRDVVASVTLMSYKIEKPVVLEASEAMPNGYVIRPLFKKNGTFSLSIFFDAANDAAISLEPLVI